MFTSFGYFKSITCPDSKKQSGCKRPYCHFHHSIADLTKKANEAIASSSNEPTTTSSKITSKNEVLASNKLLTNKEDNNSPATSSALSISSEQSTSTISSNAAALQDIDPTTLLEKLVSEAVKKVISENPMLGSVALGKVNSANIVQNTVKDLASQSLSFSNFPSALTETSHQSSKKQKLYLPPPGVPSYNPTPISVLNKNTEKAAGNSQPDYVHSVINDNELGDGEFSPAEDEESKADFDLLEEVMIEHSSDPIRAEEIKKRKMQLQKNNKHFRIKNKPVLKLKETKPSDLQAQVSSLDINSECTIQTTENTIYTSENLIQTTENSIKTSENTMQTSENTINNSDSKTEEINSTLTKSIVSLVIKNKELSPQLSKVEIEKRNFGSPHSHSMIPKIAHLSFPSPKDLLPVAKVAPSQPLQISDVEEMLAKLDGNNDNISEIPCTKVNSLDCKRNILTTNDTDSADIEKNSLECKKNVDSTSVVCGGNKDQSSVNIHKNLDEKTDSSNNAKLDTTIKETTNKKCKSSENKDQLSQHDSDSSSAAETNKRKHDSDSEYEAERKRRKSKSKKRKHKYKKKKKHRSSSSSYSSSDSESHRRSKSKKHKNRKYKKSKSKHKRKSKHKYRNSTSSSADSDNVVIISDDEPVVIKKEKLSDEEIVNIKQEKNIDSDININKIQVNKMPQIKEEKSDNALQDKMKIKEEKMNIKEEKKFDDKKVSDDSINSKKREKKGEKRKSIDSTCSNASSNSEKSHEKKRRLSEQSSLFEQSFLPGKKSELESIAFAHQTAFDLNFSENLNSLKDVSKESKKVSNSQSKHRKENGDSSKKDSLESSCKKDKTSKSEPSKSKNNPDELSSKNNNTNLEKHSHKSNKNLQKDKCKDKSFDELFAEFDVMQPTSSKDKTSKSYQSRHSYDKSTNKDNSSNAFSRKSSSDNKSTERKKSKKDEKSKDKSNDKFAKSKQLDKTSSSKERSKSGDSGHKNDRNRSKSTDSSKDSKKLAGGKKVYKNSKKTEDIIPKEHKVESSAREGKKSTDKHKLANSDCKKMFRSSDSDGAGCSPIPDLSALDDIEDEDLDELMNDNNQNLPSDSSPPNPDSTCDSDDANDPRIMEECLKVFSEYTPDTIKTNPKVAKKKEEPDTTDFVPVRKYRQARAGATGNLLSKSTTPLSRPVRRTPAQVMLERYQKLKEEADQIQKKLGEEKRRLQTVLPKNELSHVTSSPKPLISSSSVSSTSGIGSSEHSDLVPLGRKRIPRPPSNVAALINAKKKMQQLKASSSSSNIPKSSVKSAASSSSKNKTTLAMTNPKGKKRIAHMPNMAAVDLERPILVTDASTKVPQNIRQRYLNTFVDETVKFCDSKKYAYDVALSEEKVCHERATTRNVYLNLAVNTLKRLRSKQISEGAQELLGTDRDTNVTSDAASTSKPLFNHPINPNHKVMTHFSVMASGGQRGTWSIQTNKKSLLQANIDEKIKGKNFYKYIKKYMLTEKDLEENGFPRVDPSEKGKAIIKKDNFRKKITPNAFERICARCSTVYAVDEYGIPLITNPCVYHWGRPYKTKGPTGLEKRYSCCQSSNSEDGCCQADIHVSENYSPDSLRGFVRTLPKDEDHFEVYALDCEMCYTTEGNELTRVTVIDSNKEIVYETLVRPDNPIIDYNTRFSGITAEDMENVTVTIRDVQAALLTRFSNKTILIGHSLESDFLALKLIHDTVVDTSITFPHKLGFPYKRALRNLASEILRKLIQNDIGGHDSAEDAVTCIELMQWKVKEDLKVAVFDT